MKVKPVGKEGRPSVSGVTPGVLILFVVTVLLATFSVTKVALSRSTSLDNNGNWVSTKTLLENGVNGTYAFVDGTQSLAGQKLNLGAWCGFQEVIYKDRLTLGEVSFDFLLEPKSYITFIFNRTDERFNGLRFSIHPRFANLFFTADADMLFLEREDLNVPVLHTNAWNTCRVSFTPDGFSAVVNGTTILEKQMPILDGQLIGFRGCMNNSYIDNVTIRSRSPLEGTLKPTPQAYESFSHATRSVGRNFLWSLVGVLMLSLVVAGIATLVTRDARGALLRVATLNVSLAVVGFALYVFIDRVQSRRYPNPGVNVAVSMREESFKNELRARQVGAILDAYPRKGPDTFRILFLGTSQTWGAGARRLDESIVKVVEKRLNEGPLPGGKHFECINGGLSGLTAETLRYIFRDDWIKLAPDLVVINLSNNDVDHDLFAEHLDALAAFVKQQGIRVVMITEPNTIEQEGDFLETNHRIMREVAQRRNVPLVEMQKYLLSQWDVGFLWWDHVHLTSLGQRLFANHLVEALYRYGLVTEPPREDDDQPQQGEAGEDA